MTHPVEVPGRVVGLAILAANGRRVAWAWAAFLAFSVVAFPLFDAVNGMPDVTPLDIRFFYGPDDIRPVLAEFGEQGRNAYLRSLLIADVAWPAIYGWTLAISIAWGFEDHPWQVRLTWIPIVTVLLDLLENLLISYAILRFPALRVGEAVTQSAVSGAKWVAAGTATVLALVALGRRAVLRRRSA